MATGPAPLPGIQWIAAAFVRYLYVLQLVAGLVLVVVGYHTGNRPFDLLRNGVTADGRVVDYRERIFGSSRASGASSRAFMPIIEFKAGDRTIRFEDWRGSSVASGLNNVVPVLYAPAKPTVAMIDRRVWNWLPWAPMFGVGVFLLLVGIKGWLRRH